MNHSLKKLELCLTIQHADNKALSTHYLNKDQTTKLLQMIGDSIAQYYPEMASSSLIGVGSLYQMHQIIRPNFPIYTQLFELAKMQLRPKNFKPSIIGIGAEQEGFSINLFNKDNSPFSEVIHVLPFTVIMPESPETEALFINLEEKIVEIITPTIAIQETLHAHFNLTIEHLKITTLADLNGLFAIQLIQIGLEELWEIIKAVIFNLDEKIVTLGSGHILYWKLDEVAIFAAHPSIFADAMRDYDQALATYQATTMSLEVLFTSHHIPFATKEVFDASLFQKPATIERARRLLNSHIKAL